MNEMGMVKRIVARSVMAGTWSLPKTMASVDHLVQMIKNMQAGKPPVGVLEDEVVDAFYGFFGDDILFDKFHVARKIFYEACAEHAARRIKEMAAQDDGTFKRPEWAVLLRKVAARI